MGEGVNYGAAASALCLANSSLSSQRKARLSPHTHKDDDYNNYMVCITKLPNLKHLARQANF